MNFVRYGDELINLDNVTNIKFLKAEKTSDENAIVFVYEKGHETVISFGDSAFDTAKLNLLNNVGVLSK